MTESFHPGSATADLVKAGIVALLGYPNKGDIIGNAAFQVDLPAGRFLIVGIELRRGGNAIPENAVSFCAYKEGGNRFVLAAHVDGLDADISDYLVSLQAKALTSPIKDEFWFVASAEVPPKRPASVAIRLYAFGGSTFRMVWAPRNILAEGPERAVELIPGGFIVNRLFDPTGQAALSPTVVIHEQYVLTVDGPQKWSQWQTERQ